MYRIWLDFILLSAAILVGMALDLLLWKLPIATIMSILSIIYADWSMKKDIKNRHNEVMRLAGSSIMVPKKLMRRYSNDMFKFFNEVHCGDRFVPVRPAFYNNQTLDYENLGTFTIFNKKHSKTINIKFDIPTESYEVHVHSSAHQRMAYNAYLVDQLIDLVNELIDERYP